MSKQGQLSLWRYFAIEGLSSFVCCILQMGIFFWATQRHGFSPTECLLLGATQGLAYTLSARFGGARAAHIGYDRVLQITMIGTAATTLLLWNASWRWIPFVLMTVFIAFTGPFWPSTEASVLHARSTLSAPRRLGLYNMTWSSFGAVGFFACGFLVAHNINSVIWLPGIVMATQLLFFAIPCRARTGVHEEAIAHDENAALDARTKQRFMHLHWLSNSLAYFLMTSFSAMLPHLGQKLGLSASAIIWLTCSYLFSRAVSFAIFTRWEGWHYHAAWSQASIWLTLACAAIMFFATIPALVLGACILFGLALGLAYSGSLYYSMNFGENKGEHGGLHEAILGGGILFGPLAGAGGSALFGADGAAAVIVTSAAILATLGLTIIARANR